MAPLELRLFGRDPVRVARIARFCTMRARVQHEPAARALRFVAAPSLEAALAGADLVVNQVRVGGFAARSHDETFPLRFGLPGDETIGPGGLANALRTVPVALALARAAERLAPRAPFLQLSNPMGIVVAALTRATRLCVLGVCELPQDTLERAAALVGARGPLDGDYVGLNHQGFFTSVRSGGRELLPEIARALARDGAQGWFGVDGAFVAEFQALPLRYLRTILARAERTRVVAQSLARGRDGDRGRELAQLSAELFEFYESADGTTLPHALARREMPWFRLAVVPALRALLGGAPAELYVSIQNRGAAPFLHDDAIVEQRMRLDALRASPLPRRTGAHALAPPLRDLLIRLAEFEARAAAAALEGSLPLAKAALRAHPFDLTREQIDAILPELFATPGDLAAAAAAGGGRP
jgi:6-phospho-beta-glucosidase